MLEETSELYRAEALEKKCPRCGSAMLGNQVLEWCTKCEYNC